MGSASTDGTGGLLPPALAQRRRPRHVLHVHGVPRVLGEVGRALGGARAALAQLPLRARRVHAQRAHIGESLFILRIVLDRYPTTYTYLSPVQTRS